MSDAADDRRWSLLLPKDVPAARTARSAVDKWLGGTDALTLTRPRASSPNWCPTPCSSAGRRSS